MTVKSVPTGAQVVLNSSGIRATTDNVVNLPDNIFGNADSIAEILIFSKEGYKTLKKPKRLYKDTWSSDSSNNRNIVATVTLEEYDTVLEIISTPAPIHVQFVPNALSSTDWHDLPQEVTKDLPSNWPKNWPIDLAENWPEDWPIEFTTPVNLKCTSKEANALMSFGLFVDDEYINGFIPTGNYRALTNKPKGYALASSLKPGHKNKINISLKPVVTTLQIVSEPEGVVVEDISTGGFGYLGTTPLVRNFNWEDVLVWSDRIKSPAESYRVGNVEKKGDKERVGDRRKKIFGSSLYIDLRLSKPGFQDTYLRRLRLPIGEERSFHKNMNALTSSLTFASDPAGVHVYVLRTRDKEVYDAEKGQFQEISVSFKKHLGTTPFTLTLDPTDPLKHGDQLIFEKSGYNTGEIDFAEGEANYYKVMVPVNIMER